MRTLFLALCCAAAFAGDAAAQRVFDEWPVRTSAGPDALLQGVEAVYWNPAALETGRYRGAAMITDQRTPDIIGVGGFGAAGAWRLDARTTVGLGYQRISIDDIGETTESPLPDPSRPATFSIGEDQVTVGASHKLSNGFSAGAGVRYDRSDEAGFSQATTSLSAGLLVHPTFLPLLAGATPAVGAAISGNKDGMRWSGGVDFALPLVWQLSSRVGYGVRGGEGMAGPEHRMGVTALWREMISLTAGIMSGTSGGERELEPTIGASLRVNRYELGVLREALSNEFGAAYSFRLRVGID